MWELTDCTITWQGGTSNLKDALVPDHITPFFMKPRMKSHSENIHRLTSRYPKKPQHVFMDVLDGVSVFFFLKDSN